MVQWFTRSVPLTPAYHQDRFIVRWNGSWAATPLLLVLVCVEVSDLVFAVDSIPAIFGVTLDLFNIYTSNVFAIMGLRSLYFVLAGVMDKFCYLRAGLGLILAFVGTKMLLAHTPYKIDTFLALGVVLSVLFLSISASLARGWWRTRRQNQQATHVPSPGVAPVPHTPITERPTSLVDPRR